jgi:Protein of unknown function (DUF3102)
MSTTLNRPSKKTKRSKIADEINQLHEMAESSSRACLESAIKAGELLVAEKAKLVHGEWGPWIKDNLPLITWRTVNYYMRLFKRQGLIKLEMPSNLTITDALNWLSDSEVNTDDLEDDEPAKSTEETTDDPTNSEPEAKPETEPKEKPKQSTEAKVEPPADPLSEVQLIKFEYPTAQAEKLNDMLSFLSKGVYYKSFDDIVYELVEADYKRLLDGVND